MLQNRSSFVVRPVFVNQGGYNAHRIEFQVLRFFHLFETEVSYLVIFANPFKRYVNGRGTGAGC